MLNTRMIKKITSNTLQLSDLPDCLRKYIDPDTFQRDLLIRECASETPANAFILDAGAGECQYKKYFQKNNYVACDLGIGEKSWDYKKLNVISNLEKLPFKDNIFKSIICIQVLEHVKEPQFVLNEFYRVLQHNGYLYLSVPQVWCVNQAPFDFYRYTNYGIQYLLEKANFSIQYIKPTTGYFGYLANRLIFLPKITFWTIKSKFVRFLLLPFEFLSYIIFVLVLPIILNLCDRFDKQRDFTLNYLVKAKK